jgi:hypothetical protein
VAGDDRTLEIHPAALGRFLSLDEFMLRHLGHRDLEARKTTGSTLLLP